MATCIYDNLHTLQRELWENGKIIGTLSCEYIQTLTEEFEILFGLMINSKFVAGMIYGDPTAMIFSAPFEA